MWVGLVIVAVSVVAGARVLGSADDSVAVWAVGRDLGPGARLDPDADLIARRLRFADTRDLDHYLRADDELPAELYLTRTLTAGELLPRAALGAAADTGVVQVPVKVAAEAVPPSVGVGSRVDVYVSGGTERDEPAQLVLEDVAVTAAPSVSERFGGTGDRQLVLGVPAEQDDRLPEVVGAAAVGTVTIVGRS